jgi:hypothetical protein
MDNKKFLLFTIILMMAVSSLCIVSAEPSDSNDGKQLNTTISCTPGVGSLDIYLNTSESGNIWADSDNCIVYVNVTDEDDNTEQYNITEWMYQGVDFSIFGDLDLEPGTYDISIYFPGDDLFNESSFNDTVTILSESDMPDEPSSDVDDNDEDDGPIVDRVDVDIPGRSLINPSAPK